MFKLLVFFGVYMKFFRFKTILIQFFCITQTKLKNNFAKKNYNI